MKNTILILISLLVFTGVIEGKEVSYLEDRNGIKYEVNSEVAYTGKYVEWYPDGQKRAEGNYKDGKLDGWQTAWHENGTTAYESNYKDGKWDGLQGVVDIPLTETTTEPTGEYTPEPSTGNHFISLITIFISSFVIAIPLAAINAKYFHGKPSITSGRVLVTIFGAFVFSLIITHLTLTMKGEQVSLGWLYYVVGLFCCIPYHMKSLVKNCNDHDHFMDGLGILSSVIAYGVVVAFWSSFFSDPYSAGFLYEISWAISNF
jgi:hypothetical protein